MSEKRKTIILTVALTLSLGLSAVGQDYSIGWYTIDGGGVMRSTGGDYEISSTIGQADPGESAGGEFTLSGGFWIPSCAVAEDCDDGDDCTIDKCDPGDPEAGGNGCVHEYQVQVYADICEPYDPPDGPQPNLDDILCLLDDFADGPAVDGCTCNGFRKTTDLHPCPEDGGGDASIGLDDILYMLDAFGGNPPCDDQCPE